MAARTQPPAFPVPTYTRSRAWSGVQMLRQCGFHMRHRSRSAEEVLFVRTRAVEACS